MEIALAGAIVALLAGHVYLFLELHRVRAVLLLPKRGIPKAQIADAVAKRAIAAAVAELREYERGHVERQEARLQKQVRRGEVPKSSRPHGAYDPDQAREFVRIRVSAAYARAGKEPPENLEQLVRQELSDEE